MTDAFYTMLGIVLPIVIVQGVQVWQTSRNAKAAKVGREEIKAQVCEVKDQIDTVRLTKDEMHMIMQGRERQIMVEGIAIGKRQSDFGPLRTDTIDITKDAP